MNCKISKSWFKKVSKLVLLNAALFSLFVVLLEIGSFFYLEVNRRSLLPDRFPEYSNVLKHSSIDENRFWDHIFNVESLIEEVGDVRELNPETLYSYKPDLTTETYFTNSLGMLDEEPVEFGKTALLIGASVAAGQMPRNASLNIDDYLEKYLNEGSGGVGSESYIQVLNGAVGGYVSSQEVYRARQLLNEFVPKCIFVVNGANDIDVALRLSESLDVRSYDSHHSVRLREEIQLSVDMGQNWFASAWYFLQTYPLRSSYLIRLIEFVGQSHPEPNVSIPNSFAGIAPNSPELSQLVNSVVDRYIDNLKVLSLFSTNYGVNKVIVGLQPTIYGDKPLTPLEASFTKSEVHKALYKQVYRELKTRIVELDLPNVFLTRIDESFDEIKEDLFRDEVHFLEKGNEIIARGLLAKGHSCE